MMILKFLIKKGFNTTVIILLKLCFLFFILSRAHAEHNTFSQMSLRKAQIPEKNGSESGTRNKSNSIVTRSVENPRLPMIGFSPADGREADEIRRQIVNRTGQRDERYTTREKQVPLAAPKRKLDPLAERGAPRHKYDDKGPQQREQVLGQRFRDQQISIKQSDEHRIGETPVLELRGYSSGRSLKLCVECGAEMKSSGARKRPLRFPRDVGQRRGIESKKSSKTNCRNHANGSTRKSKANATTKRKQHRKYYQHRNKKTHSPLRKERKRLVDHRTDETSHDSAMNVDPALSNTLHPQTGSTSQLIQGREPYQRTKSDSRNFDRVELGNKQDRPYFQNQVLPRNEEYSRYINVDRFMTPSYLNPYSKNILSPQQIYGLPLNSPNINSGIEPPQNVPPSNINTQNPQERLPEPLVNIPNVNTAKEQYLNIENDDINQHYNVMGGNIQNAQPLQTDQRTGVDGGSMREKYMSNRVDDPYRSRETPLYLKNGDSDHIYMRYKNLNEDNSNMLQNPLINQMDVSSNSLWNKQMTPMDGRVNNLQIQPMSFLNGYGNMYPENYMSANFRGISKLSDGVVNNMGEQKTMSQLTPAGADNIVTNSGQDALNDGSKNIGVNSYDKVNNKNKVENQSENINANFASDNTSTKHNVTFGRTQNISENSKIHGNQDQKWTNESGTGNHLNGGNVVDKANRSKDGSTCHIGGSWASEVAGMNVIIAEKTTGDFKVHLENTSNLQNGTLSIKWKVSGQAPFGHGGPFHLIATDFQNKKIATFVGQCRVCEGMDMIIGVWQFLQHAHDCKDVLLASTQRQDVFRREKQYSTKSKTVGNQTMSKTTNLTQLASMRELLFYDDECV
uniref:Uncharacterized protein n=1 Tax=Timema poppense TaxID=170557 RepID=A0A7R9D147_TIMPO|nr:unnamed protein product [Timema poppensis]